MIIPSVPFMFVKTPIQATSAPHYGLELGLDVLGITILFFDIAYGEGTLNHRPDHRLDNVLRLDFVGKDARIVCRECVGARYDAKIRESCHDG